MNFKFEKRVFNCNKCWIKFKREKTMNEHIDFTHKNIRNMICIACNKAFEFKTQYHQHLVLKHGEKKFKCDFCDHKSTSKHNVTVHMRKHTGDKPFACEYCPQML